jgi:hypothetical protein
MQFDSQQILYNGKLNQWAMGGYGLYYTNPWLLQLILGLLLSESGRKALHSVEAGTDLLRTTLYHYASISIKPISTRKGTNWKILTTVEALMAPMAAFVLRFLSTLLLVQLATANNSLCPLLGPDFPPPRHASQNPGFRNTLDSFSDTIRQLLSTGNSSYGQFDSANNSFSINVFSVFSDTPLYEYHHTAPVFSNGSIGTKTVDGDTVFRVGSISKLFTVFALLIEKGDVNFNDPVTKYVPELRDAPRNTGAINAVQWDDVTIGNLASQMSGIGRDCKLLKLAIHSLPDAENPSFRAE